MNVCITIVETPYNIRNLHVGLDVRETSFSVEMSSNGSRLNLFVRFGLVVRASVCG